MGNIDEILKSCIRRYTIGDCFIDEETDIITDLGLDSIAYIQLTIDIEKIFNFEFEDEVLDYQVIAKYDNLLKYVNKKVGEKFR